MHEQSARTWLGFDYSQNKIGIAVGQNLTCSATPLKTLKNHNKIPDWQAIDRIIEEWRPYGLVIGLPLNMDGSEQDTTQATKDFGFDLKQRYNLPVFFMDERLTSREASHLLGYSGHTSPLRQSGRGKNTKKRKQAAAYDIDQVAAQLILQSWFDDGMPENILKPDMSAK